MTEFIQIPVPVERILDVYRYLTSEPTKQEVAPSTVELSTIEPSRTPQPRRGPRASNTMVERAKPVVKRLDRNWTTRDLAYEMRIHMTTAGAIIKALIEQEWVEITGEKRLGGSPRPSKLHRYIPASEAPHPKPDDPPEVTGRAGPIRNGRGTEVAGTGRRQTLGLSGETKQLVNRLRQQGWVCKYTGGDHVRATKGSAVEIFAKSPSDHRALDNAKARLRKAGANV